MDKFQANVLAGFLSKELGKEGDFVPCEPKTLLAHGTITTISLENGKWRVSLSGSQHNRNFGGELEGVAIKFKLITTEQLATLPTNFGGIKLNAKKIGSELCRKEDYYGTGWLEKKPIYKATSNWSIVIPVTKQTINGYDLYQIHGRKWQKQEGATAVNAELFTIYFNEHYNTKKEHFCLRSEAIQNYLYQNDKFISHGDFTKNEQEDSYCSNTHSTIANSLQAKIYPKEGFQWSAQTSDCFQWAENAPAVFKDITWSDWAKNYAYGKPVSNTIIREWIQQYQPEMVVLKNFTSSDEVRKRCLAEKKPYYFNTKMVIWYPEFSIEGLQESIGDLLYPSSMNGGHTISGFMVNGKALLIVDGNLKQLDEWFTNRYCFVLRDDIVQLYNEISTKYGHIRINNSPEFVFDGGLYNRSNLFIPANRPVMEYYNCSFHKTEQKSTFHGYAPEEFSEELKNNGYKQPEIISEDDQQWVIKSNYKHDLNKYPEYWAKEYPRTEEGYFIIAKSSVR